MMIKHFSFYGRRYYLKLEYLQSGLFFIIFVLCASLSAWQFQRAESSRLAETKNNRQKTPTHQLKLSGSWSHKNFLLDNRTHKGSVGYYHLGLFKPENSQANLLVNLGWLKSPVVRSDIPRLTLPNGMQTITLTQIPLIKPIVWSTDHWPSPSNANWPKRIQSIDIERFKLATQHEIEADYWQLISGEGKLIDIFHASPYLNKHKHLGYAMQWLLIAIAALIIGLLSNIKEDTSSLEKQHNKP